MSFNINSYTAIHHNAYGKVCSKYRIIPDIVNHWSIRCLSWSVFHTLITLQDLHFQTTYFVKPAVFISIGIGICPKITKDYSEYFFNFTIQWRTLLCILYTFFWNKCKYKKDGLSCSSVGIFTYWVCVCVSVCKWVCM